jgi:hypothetical protein
MTRARVALTAMPEGGLPDPVLPFGGENVKREISKCTFDAHRIDGRVNFVSQRFGSSFAFFFSGYWYPPRNCAS